jgi:3-oxoacyl-[acyl-carrier-protein] synthase III
MGVFISKTEAYFEFNNGENIPEKSRQVFTLAEKTVTPIITENGSENISHLIAVTTCPDMLSPSLGQMLNEKFHSTFSNSHTIDVVQGCAGGVTAMILASQLVELHKSSIIVIQADAAKKATSKSKSIHKIFGNGSFACTISYDDSDKRLLHYKSKQYKGLSEVVTVKLGHDSDEIIIREAKDMATDPRKHLGLDLNKTLALQLIRNAESFYNDFVKESTTPDMMILHQVNPDILKLLKSVFSKYKIEFVDGSATTGNCGAASVGIALHHVRDKIQGKKILLCGFGTGGVITAGLWQN